VHPFRHEAEQTNTPRKTLPLTDQYGSLGLVFWRLQRTHSVAYRYRHGSAVLELNRDFAKYQTGLISGSRASPELLEARQYATFPTVLKLSGGQM